MDDLINLEFEFEIKLLREQIQEQEKQIKELKRIIHENELGDEIGEPRPISPEEEICVQGIEQILELVKNKAQTSNDIRDFDTLHKNLRMIRGQSIESKGRQKKVQIGDLLKIVEGKKDA